MAIPVPRRSPEPLAVQGADDDAPLGGRAERRLVRAAQRGSREDFEALFAAHWRRAHRTAWLVVHDAEAAEDIAQEAFIAALKAFDSFDRRRPFGPWLTRIVINRAIDWARARRLRAVGPPAPPAGYGGIEQPVYSQEIVAALAALPAEQRAVVVLRHLLEYSPGEIAELLDLPRGTVNSRLRRALDRLGGLLGEEHDDGA